MRKHWVLRLGHVAILRPESSVVVWLARRGLTNEMSGDSSVPVSPSTNHRLVPSGWCLRRVPEKGDGVGASGWEYRVRFEESVETTLRELQQATLASGDYIWPWENFDPEHLEELDEEEIVPRPTSLTDLAAAKQVEDFWDEGTHSILDVDRISHSDEFAAIRPLTAAELTEVFGTEHPTAVEFEGTHEPGPSGPLADLLGSRWSGRSLIIYTGERAPIEAYFWGYSGD